MSAADVNKRRKKFQVMEWVRRIIYFRGRFGAAEIMPGDERTRLDAGLPRHREPDDRMAVLRAWTRP